MSWFKQELSIDELVRVLNSPVQCYVHAREPHEDAQPEKSLLEYYEEDRLGVAGAPEVEHAVDAVVGGGLVLEVEAEEEGEGDLAAEVLLEHGIVPGDGPVSAVEDHEADENHDQRVQHRGVDALVRGVVEEGLDAVRGYIEKVEED